MGECRSLENLVLRRGYDWIEDLGKSIYIYLKTIEYTTYVSCLNLRYDFNDYNQFMKISNINAQQVEK